MSEDIMSCSNINVAVVWTVCSLVASLACRCGTLHDPPEVPAEDPGSDRTSNPGASYNPFDPSQSPVAVRRARLDSIKTDILGKLGLDDVDDGGSLPRPAANMTSDEKQRAMQQYQQSVEQMRGKSHRIPGEDKQHIRAKRFFSFPAVLPGGEVEGGSRRRGRGRLRLQFNITLPPSTSSPSDRTFSEQLVVKSASLRLFKRRVRRQRLRPFDRLRVSVYQLVDDRSGASGRKSRKRLVASRLIVTSAEDDNTWEEFDVLSAVQQWVEEPRSNRGLVVEAELGNGIGRVRLSRVVDFDGPAPAVSYSESSRGSRVRSPTLNVMTRQRRRRRQRRRQRRSTDDQQHQQRHHADCRRGDGETRCCRYPLWVSFREIGWDRWILAPDGYRAYYCDGACPPRHRVATHYAGIRALVNGARPDVAPPPCCAATRMRPLTIAHYNHDGRAVVSVFDDMIVDECMCT